MEERAPVEIRRQTKLRRQWSMISVIVGSSPTLQLHRKTPTREARPYLAVLCGVSAHLPALANRRTTSTMATTKMDRQSSNHHRVASVSPFKNAAIAQDHRPVPCLVPQLVLWLVLAKLPTSAALRALASTTARTSGPPSRRRRQRLSERSSPIKARLPPRKKQKKHPIHRQQQLDRRNPPSLPRHLNNPPRRRPRPNPRKMME